MVGDAILGEIVGANPLGAIPRADLRGAQAGDLFMSFALLFFGYLGNQQAHRLLLIFMLASLLLAIGDDSCGKVRDTHGGIGGVDVLPPGPGRPIGVDLQILFI